MQKLLITIIISTLVGGLNAQDNNNSVYTATEIVLGTSTGQIFGTLVVPVNVKKSPVVLIIAGSGPTDRNGNSPLGVQANTYRMISENLAENGIASLRFDKRGIAQSRPAMTAESDLRFETYINDVNAWISLLKSDKQFSSIIILGHSEGSLIGMVAAEQSKVNGYISASGSGRAADLLIKEQLENKLPPQLMDESDKILDSLKAGKTVSKVNPVLASLYRPSVQPYMISWLRYDPVKVIAKQKIPVLIVQGTTDLQVPVKDANLLSAAKPDAKLLVIENMNHVLKESDMDQQKNIETYKNPDLKLKSGLAEGIVSFIKSVK